LRFPQTFPIDGEKAIRYDKGRRTGTVLIPSETRRRFEWMSR
jgi:hypothetical protein